MKNKTSANREIWTFILTLVAVFAIWGGAWWAIEKFVSGDSAVKGQFGDQFGAVNALFSGFAFAGIIFTIFLQRADLAETRNAMGSERFGNTFFELLRLQMNITENVECRSRKGKEAFVAFHEQIKTQDKQLYVFCALSKLPREKIRPLIDSRKIELGQYPEFTAADVNTLKDSFVTGVSAFETFLDDTYEMHKRKIVAAYTEACVKCIDDFSHYLGVSEFLCVRRWLRPATYHR